MAAPVIGQRKRFVPPKGATLDRMHPLAQQMQFLFLPGHGLVDLVGNYPGTRSGSPAIAATAYGPGSSVRSSTTDYYSFDTPDAPYLDALSIAVYFRTLSASAFRCLVSKVSGNGGANSPFDVYLSNSASPQTISFTRGDVAGVNGWNLSSAIATNVDYVWVVSNPSLQSTTSRHCLNGVITSAGRSTSLAGAGAATGAGKPIRVGRRDDGATQMDAQLACVAIWSRALADAEMQQLYADPFCFLKV